MKIRVTLLTENNKPLSVLGENPEEKIKKAWECTLLLLSLIGDTQDRAILESFEIVDDGEEN